MEKNTQAEITRDKNQLWPNFFHYKLAHIKGFAKKWREPDFWSIDLWPRAHLCSKKNQNTAKSQCIFTENLEEIRPSLLRYSIAWKFRGDRACILRYLDSSLDKNSILPEARQTPKILGAAINGHLISFWFLPISGHFRTFQKNFFRWIGSRNNSCNVRKTFVAIISRENVL